MLSIPKIAFLLFLKTYALKCFSDSESFPLSREPFHMETYTGQQCVSPQTPLLVCQCVQCLLTIQDFHIVAKQIIILHSQFMHWFHVPSCFVLQPVSNSCIFPFVTLRPICSKTVVRNVHPLLHHLQSNERESKCIWVFISTMRSASPPPFLISSHAL